MDGYDIIGDVHGCADKLSGLLDALGYQESAGAYRYKGKAGDRQAIFVGDLIDRGAQQCESVDLVMAMVDAGSAQMVMGNHEFNAISFATPNPEIPGEFARIHSEKNRHQNRKFIEQVQLVPGLHTRYIEWFKTLPLYLELELELGGIRVVHACWDDSHIARLRADLGEGGAISDDFIVRANMSGTPEHAAIETLLKGPELDLDLYGQPGFIDKDGHLRHHARIRWWSTQVENLSDIAEIPEGALTEHGEPYEIKARQSRPEDTRFDYHESVPVFYGHYWRVWEAAAGLKGRDWTDNTVCVDFSAVKGQPLVAYRWTRGEPLDSSNYVAFGGKAR